MQTINATEQGNATVVALVERCRSGDMSAFEQLMESHQRYAYALAYRVLRDDEQAKDVVQDAFIRVWKHLDAYRTTVKFTTWLYKIVVHLCYDAMKTGSRRHRIFRLFSGIGNEEEFIDSWNQGDEFDRKDAAEHVLAIAKRLPPKQRLVFMLRDVQDFTIEEIAQTSDMSLGAVRVNLFHARERIRHEYQGLEQRGEI